MDCAKDWEHYRAATLEHAVAFRHLGLIVCEVEKAAKILGEHTRLRLLTVGGEADCPSTDRHTIGPDRMADLGPSATRGEEVAECIPRSPIRLGWHIK